LIHARFKPSCPGSFCGRLPSGPGAPWQGEFRRINVSTVKDALRSIHWNVDDCPTSMQLDHFAAINGPDQTGATEMHERMIAAATE
jgi:hypothetical protein